MMDALIDLTVKSTALLVGGGLIVWIMRRASAASRHQIWVGVLCAVALLPIARLGMPALNVAVLEPSALHLRLRPISTPTGTGSSALFVKIEEPAAAHPAAQSPALPSVSVPDAVAAIWILGMFALALRATTAHIALRRVTSRATNVSGPRVLAILQEAADAFRVRRRISLLSDDDEGLPCTFGVLRPVILVPASLVAADSQEPSRLRAVLVHETAHIARLDAISERITQVAVMLFWFNPIVWLAARQARFERERAADDAVLAGGAKASDYASDLLAIARTQSNAFMSGAVPMAASGLERRVRAILDDRIRRGSHSRLSVALTMIVLAAMLPVSAVRLVARSAPVASSVKIDVAPAVEPAYFVVESPVAAQLPTPPQHPEQSDPLTVWNTERERNLRQVLRRARAAHEEAKTKAAIGTTLPVDVTVLETTIAQLEEGVKNFTPITAPMTAQELKRKRGAFQGMLSGLERAEFRFTNGLLTSGELANVLLRTAQVIEPSIQAPAPKAGQGHTSPFVVPPDGTPAEISRARNLNSLFTDQVSFVRGAQPISAQAFVYITGEVKNPGRYPLGDSMSVLQLLTLAGGLLPSADKNQVVIVSGTATDQDGKPLTRSINFNDLVKGKNVKENNLELGRGDAVIVRSPRPRA